eukprot:m51a1_g1209 putative two pore calcium channel protein 1-like (921) ;mRNA; r:470940-474491
MLDREPASHTDSDTSAVPLRPNGSRSSSDTPNDALNTPSTAEGGIAADARLRYLQAATLVEDAVKLRPVTHDLTSARALRLYRAFWKDGVQWTLTAVVLLLLIMPVFEKPAFRVREDDEGASDESGKSLEAPWPTSEAATLVEDAVKLRPVTHDLTSARALRLYRAFWKDGVQWTLTAVVLLLLIMPVFEKPAFRVRDDDEGASDESGKSLEAPWPTSEVVELAILMAVLIFDIAPRWVYSLPGTWKNRSELWFLVYNVVVALSFVDVIIRFCVYAVDSESAYFRFSRPLRVYLIVYRVEAVRVTLRNVVGAFFSVIHLFALFFALVFLFAATGVLLFDGTPEQVPTFPNTLEGAFQLLLLTTTCNHPDVYIPAYNYNWASFLFFAMYSTVSQLFFLNLMLSVIVSSWRDMLKAEVARKMILRREALRGAFAVLSQGKEYVTKEEFLRMLHVLKPSWPKSKLPFYWNTVDTAGVGKIGLPEFTLIIEALEITVERVSKLWRVVPLWLSQKLRVVVRSKLFQVVIDVIIVVVSLWPVVEVELRHAGHKTISRAAANGIEMGFLVFFTLELGVKLIAERSLSIWLENPKNKFDAVLLVVSWILGIITVSSGGATGIVKVSMTVRLLRVLFSIIGGFKKFAWLFDALLEVVPTFLSILLAHVVWMYLFSILGIEIFGDVVRQSYFSNADKGYGRVADTDYAKLSYFRLSYGSFPEAIVATWVLVIVNNWHVLIQAYVVATGYKITRMFFVCFWIIDVVCTMAVLIAVLLEMIMRTWDSSKKVDERQAVVEKRLKHIVAETDDEGQFMSEDEKSERAAAASERIVRSDVGLMHVDKPAADESATWISRRTKQFTSMMQRMVIGDLNEQDFEGGAEEMTTGLSALYKVYNKPAVKESELPSQMSYVSDVSDSEEKNSSDSQAEKP